MGHMCKNNSSMFAQNLIRVSMQVQIATINACTFTVYMYIHVYVVTVASCTDQLHVTATTCNPPCPSVHPFGLGTAAALLAIATTASSWLVPQHACMANK